MVLMQSWSRSDMMSAMVAEIIVAEVAELAERLASVFEAESGQAIAPRGRFAVALPGGSVATTFFPRLARTGADWTRTDFFWGDERCVPPEDPESNFALAQSLWLGAVGAPVSRVHRMRGESSDPRAA